MEIIYLVILIFAERELEAAHMHAWHKFQDAPAHVLNQSCEDAIEDPSFQKVMAKKLKSGQTARLYCQTASQVPGLRQLAGMHGIKVSANHAGTIKESILQGKLVYRPYKKGRKSLESYMDQEFFLIHSKGETALYESDKVTREKLIQLNGKQVRLRAVFEDRTPEINPNVPQSYPTEADGSPVRRTGYKVMQIVEAE